MSEGNPSHPLRAGALEPPSRPRHGDEDQEDQENDEFDDFDDGEDLDEESRRSFGVGALATSAWDRARGTSPESVVAEPEGEEEKAPDTQREYSPAPDRDWDGPTIPDLDPLRRRKEQK